MSVYELSHMSNHESLYKILAYTESHWLKGTRCTFTPCLNYERDVEGDFYPQMGEPVTINIAIEDFEKVSLDHENWRAEKDDIPLQAYISNINYPLLLAQRKRYTKEGMSFKEAMDKCFNYEVLDRDADWYIPVLPYSMIELPYLVHSLGTQKFRITEVKADTFHEFMWYCKLATHRDQVDLQPITPDVIDNHTDYRREQVIEGNSFLSRPSGGNGVDPLYHDEDAWERTSPGKVVVPNLDNYHDEPKDTNKLLGIEFSSSNDTISDELMSIYVAARKKPGPKRKVMDTSKNDSNDIEVEKDNIVEPTVDSTNVNESTLSAKVRELKEDSTESNETHFSTSKFEFLEFKPKASSKLNNTDKVFDRLDSNTKWLRH